MYASSRSPLFDTLPCGEHVHRNEKIVRIITQMEISNNKRSCNDHQCKGKICFYTFSLYSILSLKLC